MSPTSPIKLQTFFDGAAMLLELGPAPANIVDREAIAALRGALKEAAIRPGLKAVVIRGEGKHFSYGASVPEHVAGEVDKMLPEFHALLDEMNQPGLPPLIAEVRGRCLGGGLEVALACDLIAVDDDAVLGCPEIKLGVFPPAGSALLPLRVPAGKAMAMLLAGEMISGIEALAMGLADLNADDLSKWIEHNLLPLSAVAICHTRQAARWPWKDATKRILPRLEQQYLGELMATHDAVEGIQSFLEKRKPEWKNQ
ncbi:MAG: enoyl-CoA hydratase/isomerase family protein [Planctomycetes bacterium]|nr:enoyl-CoA hydratase/isomerase family protein [Planctomycetota bacterium]